MLSDDKKQQYLLTIFQTGKIFCNLNNREHMDNSSTLEVTREYAQRK